MAQYYMLFKNNMIDFDKILIEKYSLLGLDEIEVIILIKINQLNHLSKKVDIEDLSKNMTASSDVIREKLVCLINNQFITLKLNGRLEEYNLDDTFKKLSFLLEQDDRKDNDSHMNNDLKKVVAIIEKEFERPLSPIEIETTRKWIVDDKLSYDTIYKALFDSIKLGKRNIRTIDALLNKIDKKVTKQDTTGLQDLFNQVYGKIK